MSRRHEKRRRDHGKGRLGRELTVREQRIAVLANVAPGLASYENREFARSLLRAFWTTGNLTEKQWWWVDKLIQAPRTTKRDRAIVVGAYFVYAIGAHDRIKIGFSDHPRNRMREIQTGCPYPVRLLETQKFGTENEARAREKELHDKFALQRAHGEWFHGEIRDELLLLLRGQIR